MLVITPMLAGYPQRPLIARYEANSEQDIQRNVMHNVYGVLLTGNEFIPVR
jgi:hypothetical protein